ncbi:hypothetical protein LTR85_008514 [Meristemomyces frigidus]|nr:hypothetical protein LTR85_008514 [Meristemomyces frigidus]
MAHKAGPPPAYSSEPRGVAKDVSNVRSTISAAIEHETARPPILGPSAERLCGFLCYVLCVDYGVPTAGSFSPGDSKHFVRLASAMQDLHGACQAGDKDAYATERLIASDVYEPAQELGVPVDAAVRMILRYAANIGSDERYTGCHPYIIQRHGYTELVGKCNLDAAALIPVLVPLNQAALRARLNNGAAATINPYTSAIVGNPGAGEPSVPPIPPYQRSRTMDEARDRVYVKPSEEEHEALRLHLRNQGKPASFWEWRMVALEGYRCDYWTPGGVWKARSNRIREYEVPKKSWGWWGR